MIRCPFFMPVQLPSRIVTLAVALLLVTQCDRLNADVRLPKVFSDHMVLQRELPIAVFGWGEPGEKVSVAFNDQTAAAVTDHDGRWRVTLPAMKADNKPHELKVKGKNE